MDDKSIIRVSLIMVHSIFFPGEWESLKQYIIWHITPRRVRVSRLFHKYNREWKRNITKRIVPGFIILLLDVFSLRIMVTFTVLVFRAAQSTAVIIITRFRSVFNPRNSFKFIKICFIFRPVYNMALFTGYDFFSLFIYCNTNAHRLAVVPGVRSNLLRLKSKNVTKFYSF